MEKSPGDTSRGCKSGTGLPVPQPPQVLDDFSSLLPAPERVRLVGVSGGEQSRRRGGGLTTLPVFEPFEVVVDVFLLALVHPGGF